MPRKIYVDDIEVTELINRKTNYTWLKCKDNKTRIVSTPDYDNCIEQHPHFLCSIPDIENIKKNGGGMQKQLPSTHQQKMTNNLKIQKNKKNLLNIGQLY